MRRIISKPEVCLLKCPEEGDMHQKETHTFTVKQRWTNLGSESKTPPQYFVAIKLIC
ncbi:hypothetical protein ANANG_G00283580 [Anguilla anguilla]|uniref:Uncharacterized protein n=1 Tax=Anguilla anguilla TaxID=7936 RepID=A0A9D3LSD4_ANGAN|nr:hypothetical protein ANANG_G00283580 [Anguilla anguilla]